MQQSVPCKRVVQLAELAHEQKSQYLSMVTSIDENRSLNRLLFFKILLYAVALHLMFLKNK